jgi:hypothetical protein
MGRASLQRTNIASAPGTTSKDAKVEAGYKYSELAPIEDNYIYISHLDKNYRF